MGARPAKLPRARVEVHGLPGHVAQVSAHARVGLRAVGRAGLFAARVVGALALFAVSIGLIAALAPPPRTNIDQQIERLHRIQIDMERLQSFRPQLQSEQLRQWIEANQAATRRNLLAPHLRVEPSAADPVEVTAPAPQPR